jgi:ribose transport system permease protein
VGKLRSSRQRKITATLARFREVGTFFVLLLICAGLACMRPNFMDPENLMQVGRSFSLIAIMAVGQTLVIITGGIDLSVGSIFGLAGCTAAFLMLLGIPVPLAIAIALVVGLIAGMLNGMLVTTGKLPSFIATLGTLSVARSVVYVVTGTKPQSGLPESFILSGSSMNYIPIIVMFVAIVLGTLYLARTRGGRAVYAVGGNESAARLSGINVKRAKLTAYAATGFLCAVAGVLNASILQVGDPEAGKAYELDVIAACVIGGTSLAGGQGTVIGALLGAAIMQVIKNGLVLLWVPANLHIGIIGIVIIFAVLLDMWGKRSLRGGGE